MRLASATATNMGGLRGRHPSQPGVLRAGTVDRPTDRCHRPGDQEPSEVGKCLEDEPVGVQPGHLERDALVDQLADERILNRKPGPQNRNRC